MRAKTKAKKYEEPHSRRYFGAIDRDVCAAGTRFLCSKSWCDVKGSGDSTTAEPYASTEGENPAYPCRRSTKSERHQERQFAFKGAENATSQGYSSADG